MTADRGRMLILGDISRHGLKFTATPHDIARIRDACDQGIKLAERQGFEHPITIIVPAPADDER